MSSFFHTGIVLNKILIVILNIELGDGHYFINDPGLVVNKPIKIVGDENEPSHVILELSGEIVWKSQGGWIEGITIRRPRIATGATPNNEILRVESGGRLDMFNCLLDNQGSMGNCVSCDSGGRWEKIGITGASRNSNGLFLKKNAKLELIDVSILIICVSLKCTTFSHVSLLLYVMNSAQSVIMMGLGLQEKMEQLQN